MNVEQLKRGYSKLRCAMHVKYTPNFGKLIYKNECNNFYVDYVLK